MKASFHLSILSILAVVTLCSSVGAFGQSPVIARVGDRDIAADQIQPFLAELTETERAALEKNPTVLQQAVRRLILQQLLFKEAAASGWEKDPAVVRTLALAREKIIAESYLAEVAKVPAGYPTKEDLEAAYLARKSSLVTPREFRIAQIYVEIPSDPAQAGQARAKVEALHKKLKQPGSDFSQLARSESDEPETASRGGELGWLAESALQPEVRSRVASMAKDAISDPVKLGDGWYILKILDVKDARTASFEEVKPILTQALRDERARLNSEAYLQKLQQQHPMAINELALSKLLESSTGN